MPLRPGQPNPPRLRKIRPCRNSPPSRQETTSSNPSSDSLKIEIPAIILLGGIAFIVLMMNRKRVSEMPFFASAETAAPGVLHETINQEKELETGSVTAAGREDGAGQRQSA